MSINLIPHPNAAILIAIAEGKIVQWKIQSDASTEWNDYTASYSPYVTPITVTNLEWRIKPIPKTGWVVIYTDQMGRIEANVYSVKQNTGSDKDMIAQVQYTEGDGMEPV